MNRAKMRKAVAALGHMPDQFLKKAMKLVPNARTRQRIEARFRRETSTATLPAQKAATSTTLKKA